MYSDIDFQSLWQKHWANFPLNHIHQWLLRENINKCINRSEMLCKFITMLLKVTHLKCYTLLFKCLSVFPCYRRRYSPEHIYRVTVLLVSHHWKGWHVERSSMWEPGARQTNKYKELQRWLEKRAVLTYEKKQSPQMLIWNHLSNPIHKLKICDLGHSCLLFPWRVVFFLNDMGY